MTGLQKLKEFCTRLDHYPSRLAIQTEIERLLPEDEKESIELEELRFLFDLQHRRVAEADAYWQKETGNKDVFPDLEALIRFLLERARSAQEARP